MITIKIIVVEEFLKGKLYFRKRDVDYLFLPDKMPEAVELYLGKNSMNSIPANLIDSGKGHLRINKLELSTWFNDEKIQVGDEIKVDVKNKTIFRIYN
jgi:hypothetical protein